MKQKPNRNRIIRGPTELYPDSVERHGSAKIGVMNHPNSTLSCLRASVNSALVFFLVLSTLVGQESPQESDSAVQAVAQLSSSLPSIREKAETELLKMGVKALPAIRDGLRNGNLEVHDRCKILFERIERKRRKQLSERFLDLTSDETELGQFRAWAEFKTFLGQDDLLRRKLFLEMCDGIPLLFKEYDFKLEANAESFKKSARLALVPNQGFSAGSDVLVVAYLFNAQQGRKIHSDDASGSDLFSPVEVQEAVNFIANTSNATAVRDSQYRTIIDELVAGWIREESAKDGFPEEARWNLIFRIGNSQLVNQLEKEYESFSIDQKLKFLAVILHFTNEKGDSVVTDCLRWLKQPIADESPVMTSRFLKRPAETVKVSVKMLAESVAARLFNRKAEQKEKVELDKIFGNFPISGTDFSLLTSEKSRQMLSQWLQTRQKDGIRVE